VLHIITTRKEKTFSYITCKPFMILGKQYYAGIRRFTSMLNEKAKYAKKNKQYKTIIRISHTKLLCWIYYVYLRVRSIHFKHGNEFKFLNTAFFCSHCMACFTIKHNWCTAKKAIHTHVCCIYNGYKI
jgi:hypothetical protein